MDKKLDILQSAVNFICNWFDGKLTGTAKYVGNDIELRFSGYAVYPRGKGDVIIRLPSGYVTVSSSTGIKYRPLFQREVGFYQERVGKAFVHPHVWASGQPCWDSHQRKSIVDLFVYFLNTMLYTNANEESLRVGRPVPDSTMYNQNHSSILGAVSAQKQNLMKNMGLPHDIFDTKYFNIKFARDMEEAQKEIMRR